MGELRPSLPPSGVGAARLGGGKGERTGRGDVGASGDALSGVACAIHNYYYYYSCHLCPAPSCVFEQ